ncbi:MAG TPA: sulfotransferase [Acidimicrobiia bacterium]|nr:sulfotransferase [Acidimicrobiia bacterium]
MLDPSAVLDLESLVASARASAGFTDLGDDRFLEPLARFLEALVKEANLNEAGLMSWQLTIETALVNRLRMTHDVTEHPEILAEDVSAPIVILGLPRTGTTKLQRMMSAVPEVQSLLTWRLMNPAPFPGPVSPGEPDPRIAVAQAYEHMIRAMAPDLAAGHSIEAEQPEEETFLMETGYESIILGIRVPVPHFMSWLWSRTPRAMYDHLRMQLQYLQWQDGGRRGRPWIMKSPLHLPNFELLVDTFPGATFLHCHRDPAACIPSMARLSEAYRGTQSDIIDTDEIGRTQLELWSEALTRYLGQRAGLAGRVEILDVGYRSVVADAMAVITEVFGRAGIPLNAEGRARMEAYATENPQGRFGRFDYSLERFGLTEADIQQRFGRYRAAFAKELA